MRGASSGGASPTSPRKGGGFSEGANPGSLDAQANVLGALALVVADQITAAAAQAAGQSLSGATALSALAHFLDRPSLDRLHSVLGLTPSGAVRLVDRLEADGFAPARRAPMDELDLRPDCTRPSSRRTGWLRRAPPGPATRRRPVIRRARDPARPVEPNDGQSCRGKGKVELGFAGCATSPPAGALRAGAQRPTPAVSPGGPNTP